MTLPPGDLGEVLMLMSSFSSPRVIECFEQSVLVSGLDEETLRPALSENSILGWGEAGLGRSRASV